VLAYVFWHRPGEGVEIATYEEAQRAFHSVVEIESACFRVARLPFAEGGGYEDWYLVDGWTELGELNEAVVDATRAPSHDRAAALAGSGWGSVYALERGTAEVPSDVEWLDKPRGEPSQGFDAPRAPLRGASDFDHPGRGSMSDARLTDQLRGRILTA
jgi:hypothetical protein